MDCEAEKDHGLTAAVDAKGRAPARPFFIARARLVGAAEAASF
jgi:hypothetical protein